MDHIFLKQDANSIIERLKIATKYIDLGDEELSWNIERDGNGVILGVESHHQKTDKSKDQEIRDILLRVQNDQEISPMMEASRAVGLDYTFNENNGSWKKYQSGEKGSEYDVFATRRKFMSGEISQARPLSPLSAYGAYAALMAAQAAVNETFMIDAGDSESFSIDMKMDIRCMLKEYDGRIEVKVGYIHKPGERKFSSKFLFSDDGVLSRFAYVAGLNGKKNSFLYHTTGTENIEVEGPENGMRFLFLGWSWTKPEIKNEEPDDSLELN